MDAGLFGLLSLGLLGPEGLMEHAGTRLKTMCLAYVKLNFADIPAPQCSKIISHLQAWCSSMR